jgi:hypothetical protein
MTPLTVNIQHNEFNSHLGFMQVQFKNEDLQPIRDEIQKILDGTVTRQDWKPNLAGNIDKEYLLTDCFDYVADLVGALIPSYDQHFNYVKGFDMLTGDVPIVLDNLWVNFQKRYEFNPVHNHRGVLSFVIWLEVPFYIEDELTQGPGRTSNANKPGHFVFYYPSTGQPKGSIASTALAVDKSWENRLVLFPAALDHAVYPFYTSNQYRISVSGNFKFKV